MSRVSAIVCVTALCVSPALADYGDPWLPDWSGETGYTSQYWGLHAVGVEEPVQPLAPDNYSENPFGEPTAIWDTQSPQHFWGWLAAAEGPHPAWTDEVWGGMVEFAENQDPIHLIATVPTGTDEGSLKIFVQYDWYDNGASMIPSIAGASDVTPAGYYDVEIGTGGYSDSPWYRATRVFEFADNPGSIEIDFAADGFQPYAAPMLDSFSLTTAVGATIPHEMPIPEPATLALLLLGGCAVRRRRV